MREAHSATYMKYRSKSQEKFAATAVRSERTICLNAAETIFCPNTGTKEWDLECIRSLSLHPQPTNGRGVSIRSKALRPKVATTFIQIRDDFQGQFLIQF